MVGLLRTAVRTAVVAGIAIRVHERVAARQQGRWAESTVAPPLPVEARSGVLLQLKELGGLRDDGILTDAEFEAEKARILQGA
ncbi:hypothetical protein BWI15_11060 [Kribbella sp. ALI-6-A]|nr:hypothetical protein BWI15_11060 [Kribbella sp. ALI-6-A]